MIPDSAVAVYAFALFVAPGFTFELLSARRRISTEESSFREISRIVLASLAFSSAGVAVAAVVNAVAPGLDVPPEDIVSGGTLLADHRPELALLTLIAVGVASALAWGTNRYFLRSVTHPLQQTTGWALVLRDKVPTDAAVLVRVQTSSGPEWEGRLVSFTDHVDPSRREIVLGAPLARVDDPTAVDADPLPPHWQRVVIPSAEVRAVTVGYVSNQAPD